MSENVSDAAYFRQKARLLKNMLRAGCGDNSCYFGPKVPRGGMGTNGGCRCQEVIEDALRDACEERS